jgi:hypothetical protein
LTFQFVLQFYLLRAQDFRPGAALHGHSCTDDLKEIRGVPIDDIPFHEIHQNCGFDSGVFVEGMHFITPINKALGKRGVTGKNDQCSFLGVWVSGWVPWYFLLHDWTSLGILITRVGDGRLPFSESRYGFPGE